MRARRRPRFRGRRWQAPSQKDSSSASFTIACSISGDVRLARSGFLRDERRTPSIPPRRTADRADGRNRARSRSGDKLGRRRRGVRARGGRAGPCRATRGRMPRPVTSYREPASIPCRRRAGRRPGAGTPGSPPSDRSTGRPSSCGGQRCPRGRTRDERQQREVVGGLPARAHVSRVQPRPRGQRDQAVVVPDPARAWSSPTQAIGRCSRSWRARRRKNARSASPAPPAGKDDGERQRRPPRPARVPLDDLALRGSPASWAAGRRAAGARRRRGPGAAKPRVDAAAGHRHRVVADASCRVAGPRLPAAATFLAVAAGGARTRRRLPLARPP